MNRPSRWPILVVLLISLGSLSVAVGAWLRATPHSVSPTPPAPSYSKQEVADAKSKVCSAYEKVRSALATNATRTGGDDPTAQLAVAVNARQIYVASSAYLLRTLGNEPAAPSDLATSAERLIDLFQVLTLDGLAANPNVEGHDLADQTLSTIQGLCK